jgi:predicted transcriptional regulator
MIQMDNDEEKYDSLLIQTSGVIPCNRRDLLALVEAGFVRDVGNDLYEVTDEGRDYIIQTAIDDAGKD